MNKEQYKYMIIRQRDGTKILYYQREVQYVFLNQQFSGHVSINLNYSWRHINFYPLCLTPVSINLLLTPRQYFLFYQHSASLGVGAWWIMNAPQPILSHIIITIITCTWHSSGYVFFYSSCALLQYVSNIQPS